jgi:adenylate kinase family enzyme
MHFIKNSPEELAAYIKALEQGLIVFDGRPGAGKSHMARLMQNCVPCEHVATDDFIIPQQNTFVGALKFDELRASVVAGFTRSSLVVLAGVCGRYVVKKANLSAKAFVWIEPSSLACLDIDERDFAGDHHADTTTRHSLYPEVEKYVADYNARQELDVVYLNAPD